MIPMHTRQSLQRGIDAFKSGDRAEARKIFTSFVQEHPQSEVGWKWMYNVSQPGRERAYCLQQILKINPGNKRARQLFDQIQEPGTRKQDLPHKKPGIRASKDKMKIMSVGAGTVVLALGLCVVLAITTGLFSNDSQMGNQAIRDPALATSPAPIVQSTITVQPTATYTSSPTSIPTVEATLALTETLPPFSNPRFSATQWRKWPIVPEFSPRAQQILRNASRNPNLDPHTFIKVGDCQMVAGIFLAGYTNGTYNMPDGMDKTVEWFRESMITDNLTAVNGFGINTVLDPAFGLPIGHDQCLINETPLDCELRIRRPMLVMIGMGTNWIPNGEASFERYLRRIVDRVLETGALPILATKADNVEGNWKLNEAITEVAYDYDLPLVNVWLSVQDLPNQGLEKPPRQVYLTGDGWMRRNLAWLATLDTARKALDE